ncbi:hypothetical protein AMS68_001441 [Peltaster fructicola]|uniref:Asl1-like glycosyl hydrolase catalytic domain-containing protein n=1 Tax=Peltaster fructicola TaxID=286661 RepID=A0A6H0XMH4_9PEZI|nr:hypothetical protein AMS68_001441 [Peltaster fructicola]
MARLNMVTVLGLAATALALPGSGYGTHSHPTGTHGKHSGTGVRSHHHPSGTRASSAYNVHSHKHSHSHKVHSSEASAVVSSADAVVTDYAAKYNVEGSASSDCGTVTSKIQVTVTITAEDTTSSAATSLIIDSAPYVVSSVAGETSVAGASSTQVSIVSSSSPAAVVASTQYTTSTSAMQAATAYNDKAYGGGWSIASAAIAAHNSNPAAVHISSVSVESTSTPIVQYTSTSTAIATHASSTSVQAYTAASSAASSTTSTSSKTPQRGVAYNDVSLVENFCNSETVKWAFNWGSTTGTLPSGVKFIPTLWGTADQFTEPWIKNAQAAISSGSEYLFSFNEPDIESQANIKAPAAAAAYKTWVSDPFKDTGVKLCAPAVTNGDSTKGYGLGWLAEFMKECTDCQIDCINIHWYGEDVTALETQVKAAINQAAESSIGEVYLSEFGLNGYPTASTISTFLDSALPMLQAKANLTGYAYFMLNNSILVTDNSLNAAGQTYLDFAT